MREHVYIVGYNGNMANRYKAILNVLGIPHMGHDKHEIPKPGAISRARGVIICTPTTHHINDLKTYLATERPVLCEKPICHSVAELNQLEKAVGINITYLTMVNQYAYMTDDVSHGDTFYDYFKSGPDGLYWDCLNVIGLAKGEIHLSTKSPVWNCQINGKKLSLSKVDYSYVEMLKDWLFNPKSNYAYARKAHEKVTRMVYDRSIDRDSSPLVK